MNSLGHPRRIFLILLTLFYALAAAVFYFKYVPLVKPFQVVLVPLITLTAALAALRIQWGLLAFIFLFPLVNNLPYFFGLHEPLPLAPTALVIFLFLFLGYLVGLSRSKAAPVFWHPIFKPGILWTWIVLFSALIAFFRFSNYFPLRSTSVFELTTNVKGVTAGGALMSVIFTALNYGTGLALVFLVWQAFRSRKEIQKVLAVLCVSVLLSLLFGLYQHFQSIQLGNNPESIKIGLLNATFKDALSFGAFLGIILPVMLGICLAFRGTLRVLSFLILILSGYLALFTGSKSLVVSLPVSLLVFLALGLPSFRLAIRPKKIKGRPIHWSTVIVGVLIVLILLGLAVSREFVAREISASNTLSRFDRFEALLNYRAMTLWKLAVEMIKDYPLTGVGIGAYIIEVSNYAQIHKIRVIAESAENYMLQVTSELGFIGLFLILWILVEIFKAIRHGFRRIPPSDPLRYILVGCTAGLAAFIIIVQSHTFIGSYEIKYTAWLLVGLMALSGRKDKDIEPRPKSSRSSKMAGGALLIVFAVGSLWTSTHSLSLENRTALFGLKQNFGFYQAEKDKEGREFRWSNTPAGLSLKVSKPVMEFPLLASHPDIGEKPVTVRIYLVKDLSWKKRRLDEITLDRIAWQVRRYSLAQEVNQEVILLFEVSRTWNPQKMKGIHDQRNLGIAIGKIQFKDP